MPQSRATRQTATRDQDAKRIHGEGDTLFELQAELQHARRQAGLGCCLGDESGQSLVELALTLPALLLVVTGLMAFGVAFNNYIMLTDATAVGARQLTVSRGQTTDPCQTLANAIYAAAPLLKRASLTFTLSLNGASYSGTSCSGSATSGAPANMVLGTNAVVTVTYPYTLNLYGLKLAGAGAVLTAQTTELMQ